MLFTATTYLQYVVSLLISIMIILLYLISQLVRNGGDRLQRPIARLLSLVNIYHSSQVSSLLQVSSAVLTIQYAVFSINYLDCAGLSSSNLPCHSLKIT